MAVYIGGKKSTLYRGDYRPAAFYRGANKIAGWHDTPITAPVTLTGTYNDTVKGIISGNSVLQADWAGVNGISSQVQTVQGKNLIDINKITYALNSDNKLSSLHGVLQIISSGATYTLTSTLPSDRFLCTVTVSELIEGQTYCVRGAWMRNDIAYGISTYCYSDKLWGNLLTSGGVNHGITVTANSSKKIVIGFYAGASSSVGDVFTVSNLQLELGSTATAYTPFVPNSPSPDYPSAITSSIPAGTYKIACPTGGWWLLPLDDLRGIGDYKDKIELDLLVGKGRLRSNVNKKVFDGTEMLTNDVDYSAYGLLRAQCVATSTVGVTYMGLCTHAPIVSSGYIMRANVYAPANSIYLIFPVSIVGDNITSLKSYLAAQYAAGTPVTVYYILATPLVTKLTLTHVDTSDLPELTLADLGITAPVSGYPFTVVDSSGVLTSSDGAEKSSSITVPVMSKVGSIADTLTYSGNGVWNKNQNIGEIVSYARETVAGEYISSTGGLDTGAKVKYQLDTPVTTSISLGTLKTYPRKTDVAFSGGIIPTLGLSAKVTD